MGLRDGPGLLRWPQGASPGHVVAVTTLLASGSVKPGGLELKVKRPGTLSRPGRFSQIAIRFPRCLCLSENLPDFSICFLLSD